jgi:hypothetical protein
MKFLRRHRYDICGIVAILATVVLIVLWKETDSLAAELYWDTTSSV